MTAFVIVHARIKDAEKFKEYGATSRPTVAAFGGEFVFRGKFAQALHGVHDYHLSGVLKFPDQETVTTWYNSDAYQALIPNRDEAADTIFISCDQAPE
jgi:uncharacterized protein (DUF1330 family)